MDAANGRKPILQVENLETRLLQMGRCSSNGVSLNLMEKPGVVGKAAAERALPCSLYLS
jgi:hypothetical protein